jgi:hypothetical protein
VPLSSDEFVAILALYRPSDWDGRGVSKDLVAFGERAFPVYLHILETSPNKREWV